MTIIAHMIESSGLVFIDCMFGGYRKLLRRRWGKRRSRWCWNVLKQILMKSFLFLDMNISYWKRRNFKIFWWRRWCMAWLSPLGIWNSNWRFQKLEVGEFLYNSTRTHVWNVCEVWWRSDQIFCKPFKFWFFRCWWWAFADFWGWLSAFSFIHDLHYDPKELFGFIFVSKVHRNHFMLKWKILWWSVEQIAED